MDAFKEAVEIARALAPCANHKDLCGCRVCGVSCDPRSRAYRTQSVCEYCYDELPLIIEVKKEKPSCQPKLQ